MEQTTIDWILHTGAFIALFFLFFSLASLLFKSYYKRKGILVNDQLLEQDNPAFAISTAGYYLGFFILFAGVVAGENGVLVDDLLRSLLFLVPSVLLLKLSYMLNERFLLGKEVELLREITEDCNKGVAWVKAAIYTSSALIVYGAVKGDSYNFFPQMSYGLLLSELLSLLGIWALGQVLLILACRFYAVISPYKVYKEMEQDNEAVGIVYAGVLLALGLLYCSTVQGHLDDWLALLENIGYGFGFAVILMPVMRFMLDIIIFSRGRITEEIIGQERPNQGVALLEAFVYIISSGLIIVCF